MHNFCRALVVRGTVRDLEVNPIEFCGVFRRVPDVQLISSDSSSSSVHPDPDFLSTSSSGASPMDFIVDIPQLEQSPAVITQISMPTADVTTPDFIESFAQLRESVNQIQFEQLGGDAKKGKGSSSQGPSPPDDRSRPGSRDSSRGLSISTSLETGVGGFEEREVVAVFVGLRDCGSAALFCLLRANDSVSISWRNVVWMLRLVPAARICSRVCRLVVQLRVDVNDGQLYCSLRLVSCSLRIVLREDYRSDLMM
ncbi:hypothetical protein F511_18973 [Dorcoceras hygrometricum]|uniref:Uncharacterized protein n=1 Tax=Dorcoceras hygrometricum TaxID=472368 RepID=A0A2Z7D0D1_9LAMI|nr:hypothetical protein F511_18973 [Dorcoceras hygrometricum]